MNSKSYDLAGKVIGLATKVHSVNYLTAAGIDERLILNFGAPRLEIKKKFRKYTPSPES